MVGIGCRASSNQCVGNFNPSNKLTRWITMEATRQPSTTIASAQPSFLADLATRDPITRMKLREARGSSVPLLHRPAAGASLETTQPSIQGCQCGVFD